MKDMQKQKITSIAVIVAVLVILLSVLVLFSLPTENGAEALTTANVTAAVKAGGGDDLWDSSKSAFNKAVLNDLIFKLFGGANPVNYIKEKGADDWNLYGKNSPTTDAAEKNRQYWVVNAITINAQVGNANNGMVVKLDGKNWMVTSLTLDNSGNVVVTLMLAAPLGTSQYASTGNNTKGTNMYSSSLIRNQLLTNANWNLFKSTNTFAQKFLIQPKNIQYQRTLTQYTRPHMLDTSKKHFSNDALVSFSSGWDAPGSYAVDYKVNGIRYDAWGDDYIWLPSWGEVGTANHLYDSSVWRLTSNQRKYDSTLSAYAYFRTGYRSSYGGSNSYQLANDQNSGLTCNTVGGIRPAIHLNLTAAEMSIENTLDNPTDVTTVYNGDVQTLKGAYASYPTQVSWYDTAMYEHTPSYVTVTYESELKNAGAYWVKVEITNDWKNAVNAEVDADGSKNGWTATQIAAVKESRRPHFRGDPVTEDGHVESNIVRWFKFKIEPKELAVNKPNYNATTGQFTAPTYVTGATSGFSYVPALATRFTGNADSDGTAFDQIDEIPSKRGTYTAKAILVNSSTDKTPYTGGNFVIKDADNMTCSVKVNRARLAIPVSAEPSKTYTGSDIQFMLPRSYNADWREIAVLILPDDGSLKLGGNDAEGWYLVARDAGTYTVTVALKSDKKADWCWNTSDGLEVTDDRTITVTITKKTLFVDFLSSTGAFLLQKNSNVTFGVGASNVVDGDDVHVSLQYYNADNPEVPISVPSGSLNAAALDQGKYRLEAYIEDDLATDNKNYVLDVTASYQDFTISAQGINLTDVSWQYRENGGLATPIGGGDSSSAPFEITYTGGTFEFSLAMNTATLANSGVKVDATYGVNGYQNSTQVNVTDNAVEVKVKLIPYSAEFAFNDENGQQSEDQFKIYTLFVKVNKATIDFSKLVWSATELEYTAQQQEVTIISGLPSFIEPEYYENSQWDVGEYTSSVFSLKVKDPIAAKNYIIPSTNEVNAIPAHKWKIVKKRITITWIDSEEPTGEGNNVIFLPTLPDDASGAIEYVYYGSQTVDGKPVPDLSNELTFNDILNYDQTEYKYYFVCARLKAPTGIVRSFNRDNCILIDGGNETTEAYQGFRLGGNKNPVIVTLAKDTVVYNGEQQPADVDVNSGGLLTNSDYSVIYMEKDGDEFRQMSGIPIDAGEYRVVVKISKAQSDTFAIKGEREFAYTIEKADFDMSDMKWVDVLNGNEEYTGPYSYNANVSHKLSYIGKPKFNGEELDGFTFTCDSETGTAAGTYTVSVSVTFTDSELYSQNYNIPEDFEYTWTIEKCTPDLTGVVWNYNENPFVFKIVEGTPVKYAARLKFPEGYEFLQELIVYAGDKDEYSDAEFHKTSFSVTEDPEILKNYENVVFSSLLDRELEWEIAPLRVEKAEQMQEKIFCAEGYTFEEITNLPEDFGEYFDVKVYDANNDEVAPNNGTTWKFVNIGRYRVQILFKSGMNKSKGGKFDNVKWSDNSRSSYQVVLTIKKLVFTVDGWTDCDGLLRPELISPDVTEIEKYFDYVTVRQSDGAIIGADEELDYATYYTISLKVKDEFAGNVFVDYVGAEVAETTPFAFQTENPDELPPLGYFDLPTAEQRTKTYTTSDPEEEITFKLEDLGDWFVPAEMEIISGELSGKGFGEYPVVVGFKANSSYAWGPEASWNRKPVTVTFIIAEDGSSEKGRFVLIDEMKENHPFKFQYEGYAVYDKDISEYVYSETDVLYMTRLAFNDTLEDLLAQFKNGAEIKVFDAKDVEITDMKKVLATGMVLRLMEGTTVLNQLTISVLGDIDGDGKIGTVDKAQLNAYTLGTRKLEAAKLLAGDIDGDGKIGTVDKAQLNAYTLGTRDLYSKLMLRPSNAKTVSVQVEDVEAVEELPEVRTATVVETADISEEVKVKSEEKRKEEKNETPAVVVVDTKRLRMSF